MLETLMGGLNQGLVWGLLALGVFVTFRILDIPDLTVEGSFGTGAATAAILISSGVNAWLATLVAILAGGAAGLVTALLHTKLKIPAILAGILTMIALYSINIAIMGDRANLPLLGSETIISQMQSVLRIPSTYSTLIFAVLISALVIGACYWYFGTESGSSVRATGNNERMCRAQGVNTDNTKIIGLVLSNAFVGLCGAIIAQMQGFSDVSMGVGAIVIGLASVIIGETIIGKKRSFLPTLIAVFVGSVIYRIIVTVCIYFDILPPSYLKLLTAVIVAIALSIPSIRTLCHFVSQKWIAKYPRYARHVKLAAERKAAAKIRSDRRKAAAAEARAARTAARAEQKKKLSAQKQQRQEAWALANPEKAARRKTAEEQRAQKANEKAEQNKRAAIAAAEARRVRKEKSAAAADVRHAAQKAKALDRAQARLKKLETGCAQVEKILAETAEDAPDRHKIRLAYDAYIKQINEQRDTVSMLSGIDGTANVNLKITGLTKLFNRGTVNEKLALDDVSIDIRKGDFVTVIGGNGAGKSTLLNMTGGVFGVDEGRIFLDGVDVTAMPEYRRAKYLGRVFQDPMMGTAAGMEIAENLALAARRGKTKTLRWAVTKQESADYVNQLAALGLGLETRLTSKVGLLSGGQRQALTLLMATLVEPKLLLLDEHTAALDPKTAKIVLDLTEDITKPKNLTTLMITHNMNDALRLGNRLIMMHEGRIIYDVEGEEKKKLTVADLMQKFEDVSGEKMADEKMLLTD